VRAFFKDDSFDFLTRLALGAVFAGCTDTGEVFATIDQVHDGKAETWVSAWRDTGRRLEDEARSRAAAGHVASAAAANLRASSYYDTATYSAHRVGGQALFDELWEDHRRCWDAFLAAGPWPCEPVAIPYEGTTLPGYFLRGGDGPLRPGVPRRRGARAAPEPRPHRVDPPAPRPPIRRSCARPPAL